jgi:Protein of unknown function (DUF3047)
MMRRGAKPSRTALGLLLLPLLLGVAARADAPKAEVVLDLHRWRVVDSQSGPDNYYKVVDDPATPFIRAVYRAPMETTVLGYELSDDVRARARRVRWRWRAMTLPKGGNQCSTAPDSAATVYVTWKRGLRYYTLKYVWSTSVPKGTICDNKRNPFVAQDAIVIESGGPVGVWVTEEIDLQKEFRRRFADGDPDAEVPDWKGVAIMTDGDQTATESAADYASFVVIQ